MCYAAYLLDPTVQKAVFSLLGRSTISSNVVPPLHMLFLWLVRASKASVRKLPSYFKVYHK